MGSSLVETTQIEKSPADFLHLAGEIFAVFGDQTQDSGNISYGVRCGQERYFVKTAGRSDDDRPFADHTQRIGLLRNAVALSRSCAHPALPVLVNCIESPEGPLLIYRWVEGELVGVERARREDPRSSFCRFRQLPTVELVAALGVVYELHCQLAAVGWVAVDFYDGSMIYDFSRRRLHVVDLDNYRRGPSVNDMGRMFGSTRFMAPEEFILGAPLDERTTVFTLGRLAAVFLGDSTLERQGFCGGDKLYQTMCTACCPKRDGRFASVDQLFGAWRAAVVAEDLG